MAGALDRLERLRARRRDVARAEADAAEAVLAAARQRVRDLEAALARARADPLHAHPSVAAWCRRTRADMDAAMARATDCADAAKQAQEQLRGAARALRGVERVIALHRARKHIAAARHERAAADAMAQAMWQRRGKADVPTSAGDGA